MGKIIKKFFGWYFLIMGITGTGITITQSTDKVTRFVFVFTTVICFFISYKLLKDKKNIETKSQTENNSDNKKILEEKINTLNLRTYNIQVQESIDIISNTKKPDTFFSRYDFALTRASKKEISNLESFYNQFVNDFLYRYDTEIKNKILSLKTDKAIENNISKAIENMEPFIERLSHENLIIWEDIKVGWYNLLNKEDIDIDDDIQLEIENSILQRQKEIKTFKNTIPNLDDDVNRQISKISNNIKTNNAIVKVKNIGGVPSDVLNLLWFLNGPFKNINPAYNKFSDGYVDVKFMGVNEPSAININLPIKEGFPNEKVGYYPSYEDLSPVQRFNYIQFLKNIDAPVDISYVFIFYYGLERFMFTDKYEDSIEMMFRLLEHHNENASFVSYCSDAILTASFIYKRKDWIGRLDLETLSPSLFATFKGAIYKHFTSDDIIRFSSLVEWTNKRYIKSEYEIFNKFVKEEICKRFNQEEYIIDPIMYKNVTKSVSLMLANYSFESTDRMFRIPDILSNSTLSKDFYNILESSHKKTKICLREERKKNKDKKLIKEDNNEKENC